MTHRAGRIARFVTSLLTIGVLIGVLPLGLLAATRHRFGSANPFAEIRKPWQWDAGDAWHALQRPLTDEAVVNLLFRSALVTAWLSIAVILATTAFEVAHLVKHRGMRQPAIRGLAVVQPLARTLAAGLLVFMTLAAPRASLATGGASGAITPTQSQVGDDDASGSAAVRTLQRPPNATVPLQRSHLRAHPTSDLHVVQRGESVYGIAELLASDVRMTTAEIAERILDLNLGREMRDGARFTNPAYIEVGWELMIPADVRSASQPSPSHLPRSPLDPGIAAQHLVVPGDTLSNIAEEHLGDADAWQIVFDMNKGRDMDDGRTFTDPHLIVPGWTIDIPQIIDIVDEPTQDVISGEAPTSAPETWTPEAEPEPAGPPVPPGPDSSQPRPPSSTPDPATPPGSSSVMPATEEESEEESSTTPTDKPTIPEAASTPATTTTAWPVLGDDALTESTAPRPPAAPAPIRLEHAALLAGGVLALVGVRRRQRLRSASPRARVPEPPTAAMATERRLRTVDPGERSTRIDVAVRSVASELLTSDAQLGLLLIDTAGHIEVRLTGPAHLAAPWKPVNEDQQSWRLPASIPVETLSDAARRVGTPCIALIQLGVADDREVLIDLEACGTLLVEAAPEQADEIVVGVAAALATSPYAEAAHLITVGLPATVALGHRNAHQATSTAAAVALASTLIGAARPDDRSTFLLRSLGTGGEMWEPAIVFVAAAGRDVAMDESSMPRAGRGCGLVIAAAPGEITASTTRLVGQHGGWTLSAFDELLNLTPIGVTEVELDDIADIIEATTVPLISDDVVWAEGHRNATGVGEFGHEPATNTAVAQDDGDTPGRHPAVDREVGPTINSVTVDVWSTATLPADAPALAAHNSFDIGDQFKPRPHDIVVRLMGGVDIMSHDGRHGSFERSKTVELIAWLATHRSSSTRTAARTALWELDVRDATFANVVSEARRGLARLVTPPGDDEWVARTLNEQLPLHGGVVTDAELMEERLAAARLQPSAQAIRMLRPAAELIRDIPFAGTSYLWPDAEGLMSNLVLLATGIAAELAGHALSLGDTDLVFWATGKGLRVLPGHEELIGWRMRAHARAGNLAGVRREWKSYEQVIVADAWSDGEPAPQLLALRHELLTSAS